MKKTILAVCSGILISAVAIAQPVSDRAVIPVAVTLNQILRIHVVNGGNVEFVFNTIAQYTTGIINSPFYNTDVVIAASANWELFFGAEDAFLMPTDLIGGSTMDLNNVAFLLLNTGANSILSIPGGNSLIAGAATSPIAVKNGLGIYAVTALQNPMITADALGNGGDIAANAFQLQWSCGTPPFATGATPTNGFSILSQNLRPDRYVTNVLLDINDL